MLLWQKPQWMSSTGPLSNLSLWEKVTVLVWTPDLQITFVYVGHSVHMPECTTAEALALDVMMFCVKNRGFKQLLSSLLADRVSLGQGGVYCHV